eukprot:NODE_19_length_47148_cov_1.447810.p18 type:complete len:314 gc:universal NODE_19_length_47148_cov_1.447810:28341-29282(+)
MISSKRKHEDIPDECETVQNVKRIFASLDSILFFTKQVAKYDRIHSRLEMMSRVNVEKPKLFKMINVINQEQPLYEIGENYIIHLPTGQKQVSNILQRKGVIEELLQKKSIVKSLQDVLNGDLGGSLVENPLKKLKLPKKIVGDANNPLGITIKKKVEQTPSPKTSDSDVPIKLSAKERLQALKERVLQRKKERETGAKDCPLLQIEDEEPLSPQKDDFLSLLFDIICVKFISEKRVQANCHELSESIEKSNSHPYQEVNDGIIKLSQYFLNIGESNTFKCYKWKDGNKYLRCVPEKAAKLFHKQLDDRKLEK